MTFCAQTIHLSEWSLPALRSKHPLLDMRRWEIAEANRPFPDPHSVLHTPSFSRHWTHGFKSAGVFLPTCGSGLPFRHLGCVQGWPDSAHRSLLCLSSRWSASSWTFPWWCRWPLEPGSNSVSGMPLVSGFLGLKDLSMDWSPSSSYHHSPKLCQTPS